MNIFKLHLQIELGKLRLVELVKKYDLNNHLVLAQSRKLDQLVVELQRRMAS